MPRTASITPRPTAWSGALTLDQIDPASSPTSLTLSLTGTLYSSITVESLESSAARFSSTTTANVMLARPDGTGWLTTTPTTSTSANLAAFDGTSDAAGTSGATLAGSDTGYASISYGFSTTSSPDAALLLGTRTVTLPAVATARVDAMAPGNFNAQFASDVAATAALSATYGSSALNEYSVSFLGANFSGSGNFAALATPLSSRIHVRQQTIDVAQATTGTHGTISVSGLDPTAGTLVGLDIDLIANASGTASLENLDPVASIVGVSQAASLTLSRTDGTQLTSAAAPNLSLSTILAGADGHLDFAGPGGTSLALQAATPAANRTAFTLTSGSNGIGWDTGTADKFMTDAASLSPFNIASNVTLDVDRSGVTALSGPGNLAITTALQTGGTALITYLYVPNP